MFHEFLTQKMFWPDSKEVYSPSGAGPRILVRLAQEKIGRALQRHLGNSATVKVGLLTKSPGATMTAAPVAVVCEFNRPISKEQLAETHRLAWNFSRAPLLITIEPTLVRTWSCCELPATNEEEVEALDFQIQEATIEFEHPESLSDHAAHALNWIRLASGDFYREFPERFKRDGRADQTLLNELKSVRRSLSKQELPDDTIHDLIARVIFIQFLFDRKDSDGRSALNPSLLQRLQEDGTVKQSHKELASILRDHQEAYRFFFWLNDKFNGDLFPGKGSSKSAREREWRIEKEIVTDTHLRILANFVGGQVDSQTGQMTLWRQYSFDVIPLEFISSVYEEFVTETSAHYTPGFIVDFMLDGVLPWDSDEWDLQILDPACGSGIFLVKAYQRLIQRWKNANGDDQPTPAVLRSILEHNLFGVDIDPHAVRVASFSLYLTMCDEIDPKNYLSVWKFPRMRGERLIHSDFFAEGATGFDTTDDAKRYDIVVGNAPWGKDSATPPATKWAASKDHKWEIANKAIGTLFLAKTAVLTKPSGSVSLIQPASALLFNRSGPTVRFREQFFSSYKVLEIVNLSILRFELFENATSPPCIVTFQPLPPDGTFLSYICPKNLAHKNDGGVGENSYSIVIDPHDVSEVTEFDSLTDPVLWSVLCWGGRRDLALVRRLSTYPSLNDHVESGKVNCRNGIERGSGDIVYEDILDIPLLESSDFPSDVFLSLDAQRLPRNSNPFTHRKTDLQAFQSPQLIAKRSWTQSIMRFRAVQVKRGDEGVLCSQNFVSLSFPPELEEDARRATIFLNSRLAVYYLFLTSGRMSSYRPNITVAEVLSTPISNSIINAPLDGTFESVDETTVQMFTLKATEITLVEDVIEMSVKSLHGSESSASDSCCLDTLMNYCKSVRRVLRSYSGDEGGISATVFNSGSASMSPVRLVAFYLDLERDAPITTVAISSDELCYLLNELNERFIKIHGEERGGIFFQRVARIYVEQEIDGVKTPVIYIVKPDRVRYWTRSAGLRDADEVAADMKHWQTSHNPSINPAGK